MNAKYSTYIGVAILAVVLVLSPIIIFLVRNATNTIQVSALFACAAFYRCCFFISFHLVLDLRVQFIGKGEGIEAGETQKWYAIISNAATECGHTVEANAKSARRILRRGDRLFQWHRWIHRNSRRMHSAWGKLLILSTREFSLRWTKSDDMIYTFKRAGGKLFEFNLQSFRWADWVLWRIQSRNDWRLIHGCIWIAC